MTGDKGSGKSELAKRTCNKLVKEGVPVILIEEPHAGDYMCSFIKDLGTVAIFYDEFAKMFSKSDNPDTKHDPQSELLSLMDGAIPGKRLFLLTENNERDINSYLMNRPGRIFYHFRYSKLEDEVVQEFCNEMKIPKNIKTQILNQSRTLEKFSFDMLQAIVEEYFRYKSPIDEIIDNMNIRTTNYTKFQLNITKIKEKNPRVRIEKQIIKNFNPTGYSKLYYTQLSEKGKAEYEDNMSFNSSTLKYSDGKTFVYKTEYADFMGTMEEVKVNIDHLAF